MKVAFKKNDSSLPSKLIRWWTKSPYSHCELIFNNGLSFSAFVEEFKTDFKSNIHDDNDWDIIELPFDKEMEYKIYQWCLSEKDCTYDVIGILFTQIVPLSFQNPWWWFCSELCCAALQQGGMLPNLVPHELSPGGLYNELILYNRLK